MEAKLIPLKGKYYGTEVEITDPSWDGGSLSNYISIWVAGNHKPSTRELEGYYERNGKWYTKGDDGDEYEYEISDSHYETESSLEIANLLVKAVNHGSDSNCVR